MRRRTSGTWFAQGTAIAACLLALATGAAHAIDIELLDVAADRVERQRAYHRGQMPLPETPDLARLDERLAAKGLAKGRPLFIRIFKATSELEIWMQPEKNSAFVLLDTYPICHWTGTLGPKLREGDRQSPEGFYSVQNRQLRLVGRWQKAFNIGFPNTHDQLNKRTGSNILVHGGCSSVGCFAMTEQVQEEIFTLAKAAVAGGQERFHVHIFPFRMTDESLAEQKGHAWAGFWSDLKAGYDSFERTKFPPKMAICEQRYLVHDGDAADVREAKPMSILRPVSSAVAADVTGPVCRSDPQRQAVQTAAVTKADLDESEPDAKPVRRRPAPSAIRRGATGPIEKLEAPIPVAVTPPNGFGPVTGKSDIVGPTLSGD